MIQAKTLVCCRCEQSFFPWLPGTEARLADPEWRRFGMCCPCLVYRPQTPQERTDTLRQRGLRIALGMWKDAQARGKGEKNCHVGLG